MAKAKTTKKKPYMARAGWGAGDECSVCFSLAWVFKDIYETNQFFFAQNFFIWNLIYFKAYMHATNNNRI